MRSLSLLFLITLLGCCLPQLNAEDKPKHQNHLVNEKSPYLLQHANNPVDWHPWGEAAFAKAKKENKPIFLSIGYSTCHWCHVMERESFEDEEVAKLMNETFVCIKVDREERPDVDNLYMTICQMATGAGGWPLNVVLTPEKEPFFVTTYLPKESRFGRVGMKELVPKIQTAWKEREDEVRKQAASILTAVRRASIQLPGGNAEAELLTAAFEQLEQRFDAKHGGFGTAPKFPTPHNIVFLLRYWKRTGNEKALAMAEETLLKMRQGGVYDHLGGGFHRYSTDAQWKVPHFEKMLYDQAMLVLAYTEAYEATRNPLYQQTVEEVLDYVLDRMRTEQGAFCSAEDADSEGEEGKYYVWTYEEIHQRLPPEQAELICLVYNCEEQGNWREEATGEPAGTNVLHLSEPLAETAKQLEIPLNQLNTRLAQAEAKLLAAREQRVPPLKDDKVLTDWNGLMIAALARAGWVFNEPKYNQAAAQAADFLLTEMRTEQGQFLHRYRLGEAALPTTVDGYAFTIWGLLELYESTFQTRWLREAITLQERLYIHFWDKRFGGYYLSSDLAEDLPLRRKEIYDGARPAGNSVAMMNLLRLARMTGKSDYEAQAERLFRAFSRQVEDRPSVHTQLLQAVHFAIGPSYEVVISGRSKAPDTQAMLNALRRQYFPNRIVLLRAAEQNLPAISRIAPFTLGQVPRNDRATAYVCYQQACHAPTTQISKMLQLMQMPTPGAKREE